MEDRHHIFKISRLTLEFLNKFSLFDVHVYQEKERERDTIDCYILILYALVFNGGRLLISNESSRRRVL